MDDRQGQQLGNYKLLHLVGQGGFADVYLGEHIHLRTQAAIKVLQVRLGDNNRQSFLNEARTIAHLIHPYIVRVLDFGIQDNVPFLVMDYAPHGTFRQRFLQGTPLPAAPLVPYMKQTAAALQYGHDKKLIHRDVKPENMLLGSHDEILLGDFGLALLSYNSISRSLIETAGTATYMAPEQLQGKPRPASDQYALGMIAYEWLTGSCPFQGTFFEIASQQVLAQPASLQEKAPGTAAEVEKVVMRALEKDPQQRFPNVREFALALEDACLTDKQYSLDLAPKQNTNTNTNTNVHTSENSNIHASIAAINDNLTSFTAQQNPAKLALIAEASPLQKQPADKATADAHQQPFKKGSYSERLAASNNTPLASEKDPFPAAQNGLSTVDKTKQPAKNVSFRAAPPLSAFQGTSQPAQMNSNASFSMPSFTSGQESYLNAQQELSAQKNVPLFPTVPIAPSFTPPSLSPSLPSSATPPERDEPFLDFPQLSPSWMSNTIDVPQASMPRTGTNTSTASGNTSTASGNTDRRRSQKIPRTTLSHLKAVAKPVYRDNQFRPATTIVILLVMFIIVASGVGIFALSNNQKAQLQKNVTATRVAAKTATAKALIQSIQASQTAVVGTDPYLATNGGVLVFDDPLTSNKNSWQVGPDATGITAGKCEITDQGYEVDAPSVAPTPCFQTTQSFTNFAYQVDLTFTAIGQNYSGGGIIFRSSSDFKQYYYFEIFDSGNYTLQKCTEFGCTNYMDGYNLGKPIVSAFQPGINVTNTLAVVANGNTIDLFVNKQKISEVTDQISTPYTAGSIGVLATAGNDLGVDTADNTATTAIFSNAKVWKL
jgi:serine/threonine protein kinase